MRRLERINYNINNGETFKCKGFSISRTKLNSVSYTLTTWVYYLTDENHKRNLQKLVKLVKTTIYKHLDTDVFNSNFICVDNISDAKPSSKQTSLVIEFTFYPVETLSVDVIINYLNIITNKLNEKIVDNELFIFSRDKHKSQYVV